MTKPHAIVFSSGKAYAVAEAVKENLERHGFLADTWKEDFFEENNTAALNTFLKKLLCYDLAVLVLGADDLRVEATTGTTVNVPRDNVVFELGASMARMGTKKTFVIAPTEPKVTLPTYFLGLNPLTYEPRKNGSLVAATGTACKKIDERFYALDEDAFHSDLPAVGLAYGYFYNFVRPIHDSLLEPQSIPNPSAQEPWLPEHGYSLTVLVPAKLMNRKTADSYLTSKLHTVNVQLQLKDGRDMSIYPLPRKNGKSSLHIFDIPTTLLTSEKVIGRVDHFWGGGDRKFRELLVRRELVSFGRRIRGLLSEEQLDQRQVHVVEFADLSEHLEQLD